MRALTRQIVLAVAVLGLAVGAAGPAEAALILSLASGSAVAGSTGNFFDVTLMNSGPSSSPAIGSFMFELQASSNSISFTSVSNATTTAPYIFDGLGHFGTNITAGTSGNPPTITATDFFSVSGSGTTLGAGATAGLGHVFFNVPSGAINAPVTISFVSLGTSLADTGVPTPNPIPVVATNTGTITITGGAAAVPEPSSLVSAGIGVLILVGYAWRKRRKTRVATA